MIPIVALAVLPVAAGLALSRSQRAREARAARREAHREWVANNFATLVLVEEEGQRVEATRIQNEIERQETLARRLASWWESTRKRVAGDRHLLWVTWAAIFVGFVWFITFRELVELDRQLFGALGLETATVESRSRLVAIVISLLGVLIMDLVRATPLLLPVTGVQRRWRIVLAAYLVILLGAGLAQLPRLVDARSAAIQERIAELEANREALASEPDSGPAALTRLEGQIRLEREKLETAQFGDRMLILGAAVAEVLSSWALAELFGLLFLALIGLLRARAERRSQALEARGRELTQAMVHRLLQEGQDAGLTDEQMRPHLLRYLEEGPAEDPEETSPRTGVPPESSGPASTTPAGNGSTPPSGSADVDPEELGRASPGARREEGGEPASHTGGGAVSGPPWEAF